MSERKPTAQHWHPPAGWLLEARRRGAPPEALAVLAQVGVTVAGHGDGAHRTQRGIGARLGLSRQAAGRWLRRLPALPGLARDFQGTRMGAQRYAVPSVPQDRPGPLIWADVVTSPAWVAAPLAWQWVYLGALDLRATRPGSPALRTTHGELAEQLGLARSSVEDAIRYWRNAGLLEVEVRTGRRGQHLGLSLRDAGRQVVRDVPATRPSRLRATRRHVEGGLVDQADRGATWGALRARAAQGDVWGLARELHAQIRDAAGRVIPIGRIARALGTVTRSHRARSRVIDAVARREAVREDYASAGELPAPWVPRQGPGRHREVPRGWSWSATVRGIDDDALRQLLEAGVVGRAEDHADGAIVWLEDDLYMLRILQHDVPALRKATGMRIGMRPRARAGPR